MVYRFWDQKPAVNFVANESTSSHAASIFHAGNLVGVISAIAIMAKEAAQLIGSTQILLLYAGAALVNHQQYTSGLSLDNAYPIINDAQPPLLAVLSA